MAHHNAPLPQILQPLAGQCLTDQAHIPPNGENAVVVDGDSGALLSPVLQSIEPIIRQGRNIFHFG